MRSYADNNPDRSFGRAYTKRFLGTPVAGAWTTVALPQSQSPRGKIPFFWCFPGALTGLRVRKGIGNTPGAINEPNTHWPDFRPLAALGYPVIGCDLRLIDGFGDPITLANLDTLIAWAGTEYGCRTDRYMLGGESKGALAVLNNAWRNPNKVAAMWIRGPGVNAMALHTRNPFGFTTGDMNIAFGGVNSADSGPFLAAVPTHDPSHPNNLARMRTLAGRLRIDATVADEVLPTGEVTDYADAIGCTNVNWHQGGHARIWDVPTRKIVDWLDRSARGVTTDA